MCMYVRICLADPYVRTDIRRYIQTYVYEIEAPLAMNVLMHPLTWVSSDLLCWHVSIADI